MIIRRFKPSDESFIIALSVEAFSEFSERAGARAMSLAHGRGVVTLVAERRAKPVGFAVLRMDARSE